MIIACRKVRSSRNVILELHSLLKPQSGVRTDCLPSCRLALFKAAVKLLISVRADKETQTGLLFNTHTNQLHGQKHGVKGREICVWMCVWPHAAWTLKQSFLRCAVLVCSTAAPLIQAAFSEGEDNVGYIVTPCLQDWEEGGGGGRVLFSPTVSQGPLNQSQQRQQTKPLMLPSRPRGGHSDTVNAGNVTPWLQMTWLLQYNLNILKEKSMRYKLKSCLTQYINQNVWILLQNLLLSFSFVAKKWYCTKLNTTTVWKRAIFQFKSLII